MDFKLLLVFCFVVAGISIMVNGHTIYEDAEEAAAKCLNFGQACSINETALARVCLPQLSVEYQSIECVRSACHHCLEAKSIHSKSCDWEVDVWCPVLQGVGVAEAAAKCLYLEDKCGGWIKYRSKHCSMRVEAKNQSVYCKRAGCNHCKKVLKELSSRDTNVAVECTKWSINEVCKETQIELSSPSPTVKPSHSHHYIFNKCAYKSNHNHLLISMKDIKQEDMFSQWSKSDDNKGGITWRQNDKRKWVSRPGSGEICYYVKFHHFGTYFLTALTKAAGKRDYNDFFIRFSGGLNFLNAKTNRKFPFLIRSRNSYFKAYQNIGNLQRTKVLSTVNGNPHIMVTFPVKQTKTYTLCISGRSSQFSIYSLIMIRCEGLNCMRTSEYMHEKLRNNTASSCGEEGV